MGNNKIYQPIQILLNQRLDYKKFHRILSSMKNEMDLDTMTRIVDELSRRIPAYKKFIYGELFPAEAPNMGGLQDLFFKPKNVEKEIGLQIIAIRNNKELIKRFVIYKREFEHSFLIGDYEKATYILTKVKEVLGISIWYYESKFLLLEYQDKSDEKLELLSNINQQIGENHPGFVTTLLHFISHRTERNLSAYKYDYDLTSYFRKNRTDYQKDNCDYSLFKLNFFKNYSIDNLEIVFTFENTNSLVDRYLILIQVLQSLSIGDKEQNLVSRKALYLYERIEDDIFIPLFATNFLNKVPLSFYNKNYLQIVDCYYAGDYLSVVENCKEFIKHDSSCFDVLVFYCRSLIALRMSYSHLTDNVDALINQIGQKVYSSLTNEQDIANILFNLYQKNKNINSFRLAYGLEYYINVEENKRQSVKLKLLSLCHFDPLYAKIFTDDKSEIFLRKGLEYFQNSVSVRQHLRRLLREVTPEGDVSDYIREIDNAKIQFFNEDYDESLKQWQSIYNKYIDVKPIAQIALQYAFECMSKKGEYLKAIKYYVDNYIKKEVNVAKIDVASFMQTLKNIKYKNIRRCIELPIFVGLNAGDDADKSFILQSFCDVYNKTKPSELFEDLLDEDEKKIECFYSVIYKEDTLRHLIYINSTLENLRESQRIAKYLVDLNTVNKGAYQKQLDIVSNELIVYEGSQKLDESKIFANDQAIISYELKDIDGLYNRFKSILKLTISGSVLCVIQGNSYKLVNFDDETKKKDPGVKFTDNALLEVFYSIFDLVRDKFLNSKYGIVAYLSTRIRHGVLEGELRPEIDKWNLILNLQNDKYVPTNYWKIKYGIDDRTNDFINKELTEFSRGVDNLLYSFIKEKLQIKESKIHSDGLFNYDVSEDELMNWAYEIGNSTNDYQECCTYIINRLWIITNNNLEIIRKYVDTQVTDEFNQLFNALRVRLSKSIDDKDFPDIFTAINSASTIINHRLRKIEGWFKISGPTLDDFDLERLLNLVWDNICKCYPKVNVELQFECVKNIMIKGIFLIHFTDLFRIFLDNIFKYAAAESSGKKLCSIDCKLINDEILKCTFENRAPKTIVFNEEIKTMPDDLAFLTEGKSGVSKANKIVKYDLDNYSNSINIVVREDKFIVEVEINISKLLVDETNINN